MMKPILKWQYERLIKELLLLQDHQADPSCPCETESEMCVRKHLLSIEAYAEETVSMEENKEYRDKLNNLIQEAKDLRKEEEALLQGKEPSFRQDLLAWPRKWRKEFEYYTLSEAEEE